MKKVKDQTLVKKNKSWIISICIVLNLMAFIAVVNLLFIRIDMTKGQSYSVSRPTKELLLKVDPKNPMIIEYNYSDKCREVVRMAQVVQYVTDMLIEYENSSKGLVNVIVRELNYEKHKADIDKLEKQGFESFQLRQAKQSEAQIFVGFSGIVIKYKNNFKIIPMIVDDSGFEYNLNTEIKKLVSTERNKVGLILPSDTGSLDNEFSGINVFLQQEYSTVQEIKSGQIIPNDIEVLVIIGGNTLTDSDIFHIDQFLLSGGRAFIALSGTKVSIDKDNEISAKSNTGKLFDLLSFYGFTVNKDIVCDEDSFIPISNQVGEFTQQIRYPVWPRIKQQNFNKTDPTVKDLKTVNLFWASSIDADTKIEKDAKVLFHTTDQTWIQKNRFKIFMNNFIDFNKWYEKKEFNLAYSFRGILNSYYNGKEIPLSVKNEENLKKGILKSGEAQLIVIGNESMFNNNFMQDTERILFLNAIDTLSRENSLIEIRNKGKFLRPLDKGLAKNKDLKTTIIIMFNTLIVPFIIFICGFIIFIRRRIKNNKIKALYKVKN